MQNTQCLNAFKRYYFKKTGTSVNLQNTRCLKQWNIWKVAYDSGIKSIKEQKLLFKD